METVRAPPAPPPAALRPAAGRAPPPGAGARTLGRIRARVTFEGTVFSWFAVLFALAALLMRENMVFLMGCFVFGAGQAARFLASRNLRGVGVRVDVPRRAEVGRPTTLAMGLEASPRRPVVGVTLTQRLDTGARPLTLEVVFEGLAARGATERRVPVTFTRRGEHEVGAAEVPTRRPLGLFRASTLAHGEARVLVRPAEGVPTGRWRAWLAGTSERERRPRLVLAGDDAFYGIREFRDGDDPRRIHWRTTARTGTTTVTEWRRDAGREVVLFLGRGPGAGPSAARSFERAVSATATLWRALSRVGARPSLELGGPRGRLPLGQGLDLLARVRAQAGRRPRAGLRRLAERQAPRVVVYVAAGPEPGIRRRLRRAAGRGGRWLLLRADEPGIETWVKGLA